jgi:hypothetical protein
MCSAQADVREVPLADIARNDLRKKKYRLAAASSKSRQIAPPNHHTIKLPPAHTAILANRRSPLTVNQPTQPSLREIEARRSRGSKQGRRITGQTLSASAPIA